MNLRAVSNWKVWGFATVLILLASSIGFYIASSENEENQIESAEVENEEAEISVLPQESKNAELIRPEFGDIHINEQSFAITGTAEPDAIVQLIAGGQIVAQATADLNGSFAILNSKKLASDTTAFRLRVMKAEGGFLYSDESILMLNPGKNAKRPIVLKAGIGQDVEFLSSDGREISDEMDIAVDIVSYTKDGPITIRGRAKPDTAVFTLVDGVEANSTHADANGWWTAHLTGIDAGDYDFRAETRSENGEVMGTVSRSLNRDLLSADIDLNGLIISKPNEVLWIYVTNSFGDTIVHYVKIFESMPDNLLALPVGQNSKTQN